ncbi:MAG: DUF3784 domain-containing protein [Candidatus Methanoplasma sp.]|jgi:drug/metabolite transporter (DMT)-like permease|nr:DUF3784 domain-containing protein [Candidatus Methanoplasma sp.]
MYIKGRWITITIAIVVWAVIVTVTFDHLQDNLVITALSALMLVLGAAISFGCTVLIAGANTMTKEERSKYDMRFITSVLGASLLVASFIMVIFQIILAVIHANEISNIIPLLSAAAVMVCASVYIDVSKRSRPNG